MVGDFICWTRNYRNKSIIQIKIYINNINKRNYRNKNMIQIKIHINNINKRIQPENTCDISTTAPIIIAAFLGKTKLFTQNNKGINPSKKFNFGTKS